MGTVRRAIVGTAKTGRIAQAAGMERIDVGIALRAKSPRAMRRTTRTLPQESTIDLPSQRVAPDVLRERLARLDALRRAQRCSLNTLAGALGTTRGTLSRVLAGHPAKRGQARGLTTAEGLQRIEIALMMIARAAASTKTGVRNPRIKQAVANAAHSLAQQRKPSLVRPTGTVRVLLVEDDVATVELYRLVLAEERNIQYVVETARTAHECLNLLHNADAYDILLMDLGVADIQRGDDSESLLEVFERMPHLVPPRVLVVSGISQYQLHLKEEQLATLGAAFMAKPFDVEDLLLAMRSLVGPEAVRVPGLSFFAARVR